MHGDCSQSRMSMHSNNSSGSSSLPNNTDFADENNCSSNFSSPQCSDSSSNEAEILALWLDKLGMSEYLSLFFTQGYDLSTIARITPEDLLALGITQPKHRKILIAEIHEWHIADPWPLSVPSNDLKEWLSLIGLPEYYAVLTSQGYYSVSEVEGLTWDDLEDIGIKKLGHLKRFGLAIKKLKVFPHYRSRSPSDDFKNSMKPIKKNSLPLFDTQVDKKSMRLNLCSSSRILSDLCADKTSLDGTDYPPPPGFFFVL
ncbi:unnamed protein product [Dracunculus medinensis]|uniref:SAM domain-containing protein n=1 Tax=Dracunculus medinensis TaxID=318479 RepID=A0A0N4UD50_DRAME|nr:unnamed protein product [Dracunculus medinensis]